MAPLRRLLAALAVLAVAASAAPAATDPATPPAPTTAVTAWNSQALQRVREAGIQSQISGRIYALVHLAQLEAVDPAASEELAAAQAAAAAHTVLNLMFPWKVRGAAGALEGGRWVGWGAGGRGWARVSDRDRWAELARA